MRLLRRPLTAAWIVLGACAKPHGKAPPPSADATPPPDSPIPAPPPDAPLPPPDAPLPLTLPVWQQITVSLRIDAPMTAPVVGFDQVLPIFQREAYGPCTSCHAHQWPNLAAAATAGPALAAAIAGCVDQTSEDHCAGDPATADDNVDTKMPTKFGYDPVTAADVAVLRAWAASGGQATSRPGETVAVSYAKAQVVAPTSAFVRSSEAALTRTGQDATFILTVAPSTPCVEATVTLRLQTDDGRLSPPVAARLVCDGDHFLATYALVAVPPV